MYLKLNEAHKTIWLAIPFILVLTLKSVNKAFDIQLHDTYFASNMLSVGVFFTVLLGLNGLIYWLMRNKKLVKWMTLSHVFMTIMSTYFLIIQASFFDELNNQLSLFAGFVLLLGQVIFVGNMMIGLMRNIDKIKK